MVQDVRVKSGDAKALSSIVVLWLSSVRYGKGNVQQGIVVVMHGTVPALTGNALEW